MKVFSPFWLNHLSPTTTVLETGKIMIYLHYCKSEIFVMDFIFANSVKRHTYGVKKLRLEHELPTSVNNSDIAIKQGFHFHKVSRKFPNLQFMYLIELK